MEVKSEPEDYDSPWWNSQWNSEPNRDNGNARRLLWFLRHDCNSDWVNVFNIPPHICRWQTAIMIAARDPSRYDTWVELEEKYTHIYLMCRPSAKKQQRENRCNANKRYGPHRKRCQKTGGFAADPWLGKSPERFPPVGKGKATAEELGWEDTEMSKDEEPDSVDSL